MKTIVGMIDSATPSAGTGFMPTLRAVDWKTPPPWWHMRRTMETWVMNLGEETRVGGHMFRDLSPTLRAVCNDNSPPHVIVGGGVT